MPRLPGEEALYERTHAPDLRCTGMNRPGRWRGSWRKPQRMLARNANGYKIEALFSELKLRVGLRRVRLRRLWNVCRAVLLGRHRPKPN